MAQTEKKKQDSKGEAKASVAKAPTNGQPSTEAPATQEAKSNAAVARYKAPQEKPENRALRAGGRSGSQRLAIHKTYKMWVNGAFIRSEQGRVLSLLDEKGELVTHYVRASRKDLRDAITAARGAQAAWEKRSAFNRSQILYRAAEMIDARRESLIARLQEHAAYSAEEASAEVDAAADRMFWYAGWADKYIQLLSAVNPVASSFFNFTIPEATGVVGILAPRQAPLLGLVSALAPVLLSGNTCVLIVENQAPTLAIELAEILATSDFPSGILNILTGLRKELIPHLVHHMDVNALACFGCDEAERRLIQEAACESVKRVHFFDDATSAAAWREEAMQSLYWIVPFIEWKTAWHPIGS
jgi:acyl-CoA reductase-like NAD-dependent aldehyde dehydrogenase